MMRGGGGAGREPDEPARPSENPGALPSRRMAHPAHGTNPPEYVAGVNWIE